MTTGVLLTPPIIQFFGNDGKPAVGGSVLTQVGGENAATYQDVGLTTPLPNTIPLNSRGEISTSGGASSQCFLTPNQVYTFTLFDAQGNQLNVATYVNGVQLTAIYPPNAAEIAAGFTIPSSLQGFTWYDVRRYGVVGDGVTDDTVAWNAIGSATWAQNITLTTPAGSVFYTTSTVTLPGPYIALMMDPSSYFDYAGSSSSGCLVLGSDGTIVQGRDFNVSVNFHGNANSYASQSNVGVQMRGAWVGNRVRLNSATGFTVNWQIWCSNDIGTLYNTFDLGVSGNAEYHLDIHSVSSNGSINENLFLNGDFQTYSNYGGGVNGVAYGVVFRNEVGGYTGNNKNHFVKPCFQLTQSGVVGSRIPIIFSNNGGYNQFENCRFEGYNGELVRIAADTIAVTYNTVDIGYNNTIAGSLTAYMTETDGGKSYGNRITRYGRSLAQTFNSGDLMTRAYVPSAGNVAVLGMFFQSSSTGFEVALGTAQLGVNYILMPTGSFALGTYVDTSYCKNFELRTDCIAGRGGRLTFTAFGSTGSQLTTAGSVMFAGQSENSNFGGKSYVQGADGTGDLVFRVDTTVYSIKILWAPGTNEGSIRSFNLNGFPSNVEQGSTNNGLAVYGGLFTYNQMLAPAIPTSLGPIYSPRGQVIWNSVANSGGAVVAGWICKTAGYNAAAWNNSNAYTLNEVVANDTNHVYVCVVEGTSAGSGGPTGTGQGIVDGSVTWNYVGTPYAVWTALAAIT